MYQIRPATRADAPLLEHLYWQFLTDADWIDAEAEEGSSFAQASLGESVYVCDGPERGIRGLISVWVPESFIHHLYVDRQFQRQGVGKALLESLRPWLPPPWRLKCGTANCQALQFYRAQGWKHVETAIGRRGPYHLLEYP